jgi:ABC-type multidrug transport system fused ATPase/permease subunit
MGIYKLIRIIYAIALFLVQIYITVLQNRFFAISLTQGLTFKTAFIGAIFRKATRLSTSSRQEYNSGMVTNLVSTDTQRIEAFIGFGHVIWTAPIQFFIIIGLLISLLGPSALAGVALLIILLPLQKAVMGKLETLRKTVAPITDSRVKMIQEIIAGIRVIKFFTWEVPFSKQVSEIRRKEISLVRSRAYTQAFLMAVAFTVPVFSASFSLIIFSLSNPLESSRIFAALALFNQLRFPLIFAPMAIVQYVEVKIALLRIEKLFLANESEKQIEPDPNNEFAIEVTDADFLWESSPPKEIEKKKQTKAEKKAEKKEAEKKAKIVVLDQFPTNDIPMKPIQNPKEPTLTDINIKIPKGKLIAIVGAVGSGKSTLLNSFIGETKRTKGSIKIAAKIGYAPQQAWYLNTNQGSKMQLSKKIFCLVFRMKLKSILESSGTVL